MSEAVLPRRPLAVLPQAWRRPLAALGLGLAGLLILFARDAADMATIWWTVSTFEHCLIILPIIGWLVWQRVDVLGRLTPRGWPLPLLWVGAGALGWLVGDAAGVAVPRHLGLVLMAQGLVAATLGRGATAALLFPLFYAFFLVPAGDALVPLLQTVTARMCLGLLHLIRVPATIDGVFITTPGGWFKVAEACSGVKFLISMVALGALIANLGFLSWTRRIAFMALCVVVPVAANGLRAFGTIWVAQYRGAQVADGFDHVVYGWFFFAAVIALVLAASWRFFDRPAAAPPVALEPVLREAARQARAVPAWAGALAALAIAAAAPLWSMAVAEQGRGAPPFLRLPRPPGWTPVAGDGGAPPWRPRFDGAKEAQARYRSASGEEVDVAVAYYPAQGNGRSLVGYARGAADPQGPWSWAADLPAPADGRAERLVGPGARGRVALSFYDVGGFVTGSPAQVKLETLKRRLLGGSQYALALLVSADETKGGRAAVDHFLAGVGPAGPALERIAHDRGIGDRGAGRR